MGFIMPGIIISVLNNKGGTAKTTTVVTLSHILGKMGHRVLAIDNDTQCNCSQILLNNVNIDNNLFHLVKHNAPLPTCIYSTAHYKRVMCLPNDPERMAAEEMRLADDLLLYRKILSDDVRKNFDIIFIDNPPNLGIYTTMALEMSDCAIVPTEAGSRFSVQGLLNAVDFIQEVRNDEDIPNPDLRFLKLLITKVDRRTNASNAIVDHIKNLFPKEQRFENVIPVSAPIQQAELFRETVVKFRSNAPGAAAYKKVAYELLTTLGLQVVDHGTTK